MNRPAISTVAGVSAAIVAAVLEVAAGALSPAKGQTFVFMIEAQRKAIKIANIMVRVEALEAAMANQKRYREQQASEPLSSILICSCVLQNSGARLETAGP